MKFKIYKAGKVRKENVIQLKLEYDFGGDIELRCYDNLGFSIDGGIILTVKTADGEGYLNIEGSLRDCTGFAIENRKVKVV